MRRCGIRHNIFLKIDGQLGGARAGPEPAGRRRGIKLRRFSRSPAAEKAAAAAAQGLSVLFQDFPKRTVNLHSAVILDEAKAAEFIHEKIDALSCRTHQFRQVILPDGFQYRTVFLRALIACQKQQCSRSRFSLELKSGRSDPAEFCDCAPADNPGIASQQSFLRAPTAASFRP
jgi:hypothetical protein